MSTANNIEKKYRPYVIIASIVVPLVVAALFGIKIEGVDLTFLPPIYAGINGLTAVMLILAVISIKQGKIERHRAFVKAAIVCSLLFLVGYIAYHITSESTLYGDINHNGVLEEQEVLNFQNGRLIYILILISHIILSIVVIPMVMMTYLKGWADNRISHRKWAKVTFPIWLYVAISGVVVYLMISPFYG